MADTTALVKIPLDAIKLPKIAEGKVRDLYALDDKTLLFVASDRISAYDVIMENVSTSPPVARLQANNGRGFLQREPY